MDDHHGRGEYIPTFSDPLNQVSPSEVLPSEFGLGLQLLEETLMKKTEVKEDKK
jgi:hypothetical protein